LIIHVLKSETGEPHIFPVHDDPIVGRLGGQAVLLPPNDLELVIVEHADMRDCGSGPILVFALILLDESGDDLLKLKLVLVKLVELVLVFKGLDVEPHHLWQSLGFFLGDLVDSHHLE
jgi:hypothetical protein